MKRRISTAYDAYWFIHYHPKLNAKERLPLKRKDSKLASDLWKVVRDKGGNYWQETKYATVRAIESNLDIFYARVDKTRTVNKDNSKNLFTECWLELGPVSWGYGQESEAKTGAREYLQYFHDIELDCGAKTFDEALIILARKVRKNYGDYARVE